MTAEEAAQKPKGRTETYAEIAAALHADWQAVESLAEETVSPEDGPLSQYAVGNLLGKG